MIVNGDVVSATLTPEAPPDGEPEPAPAHSHFCLVDTRVGVADLPTTVYGIFSSSKAAVAWAIEARLPASYIPQAFQYQHKR